MDDDASTALAEGGSVELRSSDELLSAHRSASPALAFSNAAPLPTVGVPQSSLARLTMGVRANFTRLFRYGATSAICLGISEATLLVLYAVGMNAALAALAANLVGTVPSYLLSRYWIWHDADRRRVGRQVTLYWATSIVAMLVTSAATGVIASRAPSGSWHLPFVGFGFFLISVALWVTKFIVYERVIFPHAQSSSHR